MSLKASRAAMQECFALTYANKVNKGSINNILYVYDAFQNNFNVSYWSKSQNNCTR